MQEYFADFHVHIGISEEGKWVKIPTSNRLTLRNILQEAATRKGMQIIGIVDALSPLVRQDLKRLLDEGLLILDSQGGYQYDNKVTLILGAEIETSEPDGGMAHTLVFLPDMELMTKFAGVMGKHIRNLNLSSQNAHMPLGKLIRTAAEFEAAIVPAHVFTPHKSLYGSCARNMAYILDDRDIAAISAIELGLSADTFLADRLAELAEFTFLTNSDAHSLDKIAREYNVVRMENPSFAECVAAFARKNGRAVVANYGLDPRLGKYHRTLCLECESIQANSKDTCAICGSKKIVYGVFDRIAEIADYLEPCHPVHRPPYHHQVPLSFVPGVGKKVLDKLISTFGSEMAVIHEATKKELSALAGDKISESIIKSRSGEMAITAGGGGVYGKLIKN